MPGRKIVVIGDEGAVFGLGLIGLEGLATAGIDETREALRKAAADPDTALILLTENWSAIGPESMDESGPLVVEIPGDGTSSPAMALETRIELALGVRLES